MTRKFKYDNNAIYLKSFKNKIYNCGERKDNSMHYINCCKLKTILNPSTYVITIHHKISDEYDFDMTVHVDSLLEPSKHQLANLYASFHNEVTKND